MPAIDITAGVCAASAHVPPSVIVTCWPLDTPVLAHAPVNPLTKVTAGALGSKNPSPKVITTALEAVSAPVAEEVKPTVQLDVASALVDPGVNATFVGVAALTASTPTSSVMEPKTMAAPRMPYRRRRFCGRPVATCGCRFHDRSRRLR